MKEDYLGQMTELEQADVIMDRGVFIGKRTDGFYNILLFQVDAFYAEIYYHSHFNVIIKIKTFRDTEALEPYLQQIQISGLF
ncbi:MAG: hypothetical protein ACO1NX_08995 [Chitinophagaceae bacterium]